MIRGGIVYWANKVARQHETALRVTLKLKPVRVPAVSLQIAFRRHRPYSGSEDVYRTDETMS